MINSNHSATLIEQLSPFDEWVYHSELLTKILVEFMTQLDSVNSTKPETVIPQQGKQISHPVRLIAFTPLHHSHHYRLTSLGIQDIVRSNILRMLALTQAFVSQSEFRY